MIPVAAPIVALSRILVLVVPLVFACVASAQITTRGFGTNNNGRVITDFGAASHALVSAAIQTDGKIVGVGYVTYALGNQDVLIVRYNADGTLDPSFNGTGRVTYSLGTAEERGTAVFIQGDGKIVLCGYVNFGASGADDMFIMRLTSTGGLDGTFNSQGFLTFNFSTSADRAFGVHPAPGGGYYVGGSRSNGFRWDFALARITAAGVLDTAFGNDGRVVVAATSNTNEAYAMAVQTDGKVLLAGRGAEASSGWAVVRLTTTGALDTTFDGDGKALIAVGPTASGSQAQGIALASDGKILIGGIARNTLNTYDIVGAVRLNTNGTLDTTFGANGIRLADLGANVRIGTALAASDNSILVVGHTQATGVTDVRVVRFAPNGATSANFAIIDYASPADRAYGGVVQPDGKILVVGEANGDLAMARLIPDGTPDVKLPATITLSGLAQDYTGSARVVTATTNPVGLAVNLTYDGGTTAPVAVGSYAVAATLNSALYQADPATGTLVVSQAAQTITFAPPADRPVGSAPFVIAPTATSGLPVSVSVVSGPATISNNVVTLTGAGLVTLRASQPGDANHLPAPDVEVTFEVVSGFSSWISGYTVGLATGPNDDPDGDGLPNLVEYALGGLPDSSASAPAPALTATGGTLQLSYLRARSGVTYLVETATSLAPADWTPVGVTQDTATPVGQIATASIPHDPTTSPRRFLRLRVSL